MIDTLLEQCINVDAFVAGYVTEGLRRGFSNNVMATGSRSHLPILSNVVVISQYELRWDEPIILEASIRYVAVATHDSCALEGFLFSVPKYYTRLVES